MEYACYKCGEKISSDINKRFIAKSGECLCEKCSVGVPPCSKRIRNMLIDLDKGNAYHYEINYIYVFSNEIEIDRIDVPSGDDYRIAGFEEKQSPFVIGAMANDFKYEYAHQFKCNETLVVTTNQKDGDLNMQIKFHDAIRDCEYISFIMGLESDF